MQAAKYNTLRKAILDHMLGVAAYTAPTNVKVRLFTAAPSATGGGTAVTGGSYADKTIAWNASVFPASALATGVTSSSNASDIDFGIATANWGTIVAVDIRNAANDALMFYATLNANVTVNSGEGFKFAAGDLVFSEE